ncbi:harmonin-like [Liolophura sinensis]|uniref:harmonin-like n=1 Tax=Liolophura sinensis TaxID=3198878 RepID=UPI003157F9AB
MLDLTMERRIARNFYNKAKQLIPEDGEREQMFNILRAYQQSLDLGRLLDQLKEIINEPVRLELFDAIRPLIPLKHQLDYDRLAPNVPESRLRIIRLQRWNNESLGFAVRGGFEHGVGIYVSEVDPDSQAYHYGLRVGDEVVRVNGFTIDQAIHEEVLNLIKAKPEIVLKVRTVGMLPVREYVTDTVSWKYVEKPDKSNHSMSWQVTEKAGHRRSPVRYSKLYVNLRGVNGLGCSISSGPVDFPGVFIKSVKPGSLAEEAGLGVGDQLIDVNGTSFLNITHSEAVVALKSSSELYITLHKGAGRELLKMDEHPHSAQQAAEEEKLRQFMNQEKEEKESGDILRKILEEEAARKAEKRQREAEDLQRRRQQAEKEEHEKREAEERERRDEERRRREREEQRRMQERLREEAQRKSREIQEQREQEKLAIELQKKEERQEKKRRRMEKEKLHLQKVGEQSNEKVKQERQLRLERQLQDKEEILREEKRTGTQAPVRIWRPVDDVYMPSGIGDDLGSDVEESYFHQCEEFSPEPWVPDIRVTTPSNLKSSSSNHWEKSLSGPAFDHRPLFIEEASPQDDSSGDLNFDPKKFFNPMEIDGRQINLVKIKREGSLDIDIEGGMGTPLGGRIIISEVYPGGSVFKQGGVHKGDQLMMVDGIRLTDVTLTEAQSILDRVTSRTGSYIKIVVAKAPPKNYEDEVTYF